MPRPLVILISFPIYLVPRGGGDDDGGGGSFYTLPIDCMTDPTQIERRYPLVRIHPISRWGMKLPDVTCILYLIGARIAVPEGMI